MSASQQTPLLMTTHLLLVHARRWCHEEARNAVNDGCAALEALTGEEECTEELVACPCQLTRSGSQLTDSSDGE